jgi:hypothetical protein
LLFIQAWVNYRSFGAVRRLPPNRRQKNYQISHRPATAQRNSPIRYYTPRHSIRPRSTIAQSDDKYQCAVNVELQRSKREKQWQNIADIKRDLEMNLPKPKRELEEEEPPIPPKPKAKTQKKKKVEEEITTTTTVAPKMNNPPMMGPGFIGPPPPMFMGPPPFLSPPMGPIPRWQNQGFKIIVYSIRLIIIGPPPPWAYQTNARPPWAETPYRPESRARAKPKDALDQILSEDALKKKGGNSDEKWPLKGDSERHRWESREGSDIYWELESTKKLATWDPNKNTGPLWKAASRSSSGARKKWEDSLDDLNAPAKDEWGDNGVPKPPLKYLKEYRRPH